MTGADGCLRRGTFSQWVTKRITRYTDVGHYAQVDDNALACEVACARASNEATTRPRPSPARERVFAESL